MYTGSLQTREAEPVYMKNIDTIEGKIMKIVIIGDGKVGYKLAKQLSV